MSSLPLEKLHVVRARDLPKPPSVERSRPFGYASLIGRLVELTGGNGSICLSPLAALIREAQELGEPVAWVRTGDSVFFPPDMASNGIDLEALCVVQATGLRQGVRATRQLLGCGAFGLVVLDVEGDEAIPQGVLGRFARLAEKNGATLICISPPGGRQSGFGSLISLRAGTRLQRLEPGMFRCELEVTKDKRSGAGPHRVGEVRRGPPGLC